MNLVVLALIYVGRRTNGHTRLADATVFKNTREYTVYIYETYADSIDKKFLFHLTENTN